MSRQHHRLAIFFLRKRTKDGRGSTVHPTNGGVNHFKNRAGLQKAWYKNRRNYCHEPLRNSDEIVSNKGEESRRYRWACRWPSKPNAQRGEGWGRAGGGGGQLTWIEFTKEIQRGVSSGSSSPPVIAVGRGLPSERLEGVVGEEV
jgi:hypothetical protein